MPDTWFSSRLSHAGHLISCDVHVLATWWLCVHLIFTLLAHADLLIFLQSSCAGPIIFTWSHSDYDIFTWLLYARHVTFTQLSCTIYLISTLLSMPATWLSLLFQYQQVTFKPLSCGRLVIFPWSSRAGNVILKLSAHAIHVIFIPFSKLTCDFHVIVTCQQCDFEEIVTWCSRDFHTILILQTSMQSSYATTLHPCNHHNRRELAA